MGYNRLMTLLLPTEHLSPTQLQAFTAIKSDLSTAVHSASFMALVDILNLLIKDDIVVIACDIHCLRLMEDYKSLHSLEEDGAQVHQLYREFQKEINTLRASYANSHPLDKDPLARQYKAVLKDNGLSIADNIQLDPRLQSIPVEVYQNAINIESILSTHKKTWVKYHEIDPLNEGYYQHDDQNSIDQYLGMWMSTVITIKNDIQKGLQQIVDTEKYRILSVKKQLTQHLINYQHNPNEEELNLIKKKIGFIIVDLPKDSYTEFSDLVMFALSNWESATRKYLSRYSKRINNRNQESALIHEATQELKMVLRDIENNGFLKLDITTTPLSYETQIAQVDTLLTQLQFCQDWLEDEQDYIQWKRFYATLDLPTQNVIHALISLDANEVSQQMMYMKLQAWKNEMLKDGIPNVDQSLALFEAYKNITSTINWSAVNLISQSTKADYHIHYDGVKYSLSNINQSESGATIVIKDKVLYQIKPMVTLDYYNQSNQATYLTEAMVATGATLRTFQSRTLNIISCLDEVDTSEMLNTLKGNNINELKGESLFDLIKGSILDEGKEKIIIVYDDLLNVHQTEHYFWQRLVLQSMSSAGYKVISINTSDVLEHIDLSNQLAQYTASYASPLSV